jgi:hypothetical protein
MRTDNQLGKYHVLDELGRGGFATVYRAVDTTLDREVALKVLDPLLMRDETWVGHFRREAKTVAALSHAHIVGIYEINEIAGRLYIAMVLAQGGNLAQTLEARGRLPWNEMLALLEPVCEALDYAHGQGVVHRDLKPANILLDPDEGPLLTDFGFARLLVDNRMSMSLSGGILGTPAYIAPEIWEYDRAEAPADIYALGCIAYEMLAGTPLFGGKTPMQVMRAHDRGPQFPDVWPEDVPAGLPTVLGKALHRDPAGRYPSAGAFWYALHDLEAQAEVEREVAERKAVAAQWRTEAETAMAEGEWSAAKMAVGRWLAVTPEDAEAQAMQGEIEQRLQRDEAPIHMTTKQAQMAAEDSRISEPESMSTSILGSVGLWGGAVLASCVIGALVIATVIAAGGRIGSVLHSLLNPALTSTPRPEPTPAPVRSTSTREIGTSPMTETTPTPTPMRMSITATTSILAPDIPAVTRMFSPTPTSIATETPSPAPTATPLSVLSPTDTLVLVPSPTSFAVPNLAGDTGVISIGPLKACVSDECVTVADQETYSLSLLDSGVWEFQVINISQELVTADVLYMTVGGAVIFQCGSDLVLQPGGQFVCRADGRDLTAGITTAQPGGSTTRFGISPEVRFRSSISGALYTPYVFYFSP